jgi:hypothetical protein
MVGVVPGYPNVDYANFNSISCVSMCDCFYVRINFLTVLPLIPVSIWFIYLLGFCQGARYISISFFLTILSTVPVPDTTIRRYDNTGTGIFLVNLENLKIKASVINSFPPTLFVCDKLCAWKFLQI